MAVTAGQAGTAFAEIGTRSGSYPQKVELAVPSGSQSVRVWTDWDEPTVNDVVPGCRYYWRGGWDPGGAGGGDVVRGAEQSFVAPRAETCLGQRVTVNRSLGELATAGNDVSLGTAGDDTIAGLGGDDLICGGDGADTIDPGEGNDQVDAGTENDVVSATAGDDRVNGGAGSDTVSYAGSTRLDHPRPAQDHRAGDGRGQRPGPVHREHRGREPRRPFDGIRGGQPAARDRRRLPGPEFRPG